MLFSNQARTKRLLLLLAIAIVVVDQIAKTSVGQPMADARPEYSSKLYLAYLLFVQVAIAIAAYRVGWRQDRLRIFAALSFLSAGMTSRWIDRAFRGRPIAYLPWGDNPYSLADLAICCALVLFAISLWKRISRGSNEQQARADNGGSRVKPDLLGGRSGERRS